MNIKTLPFHVFLSYSRDDSELAFKIKDRLDKKNIQTWIDTQELIAGTPNWEKVIRIAISHAFVVVFISSPSSKNSVYVQAEIALAQNCEVPIIPIWIEGDSWVESTPMSLFQVQYIDFKNSSFNSSMEVLIKTLKTTISKRKPKHFLIEDVSLVSSLNLSEYIAINLGDKLVVISPDKYQSLQELLDYLYMTYLQDKFSVSSYGNEWVLYGSSIFGNPVRVIVPFSWLKNKKALSVHICEPFWTNQQLSEYGLTKGKSFSLRHPNQISLDGYNIKEDAFGIAVSTFELYESIFMDLGKQPFPLYKMGFLEIEEVENINPIDFKYTAVVIDVMGWEILSNKVVIESSKRFTKEKFSKSIENERLLKVERRSRIFEYSNDSNYIVVNKEESVWFEKVYLFCKSFID